VIAEIFIVNARDFPINFDRHALSRVVDVGNENTSTRQARTLALRALFVCGFTTRLKAETRLARLPRGVLRQKLCA
jgi:hypothetical protein